jgi:hypothetical protein
MKTGKKKRKRERYVGETRLRREKGIGIPGNESVLAAINDIQPGPPGELDE